MSGRKRNSAKPNIPAKTKAAIAAAAKKAAEKKKPQTLEERRADLIDGTAQMKAQLGYHREQVDRLQSNLSANSGAIQLLDAMIAERDGAGADA